jgi:dihydrofolate reductase
VVNGQDGLYKSTTRAWAPFEQARPAAGGKDVSLAGGARAAQQYLAAGIVDEMEINLVPTLLGSGERLFDGVGDDLHGLALVRTIATPKVTHLKFAGRSEGSVGPKRLRIE